ncbi:MAG: protein translocase subunit SecF [Candidatus Buchananbacteria bacterium]
MISIIKQRKIWLSLSTIMVIASIIVFAMYGLKPGIDFTGGSSLEISFNISRPTKDSLSETLAPLGLTNLIIQPVGDNGYNIRSKSIDEKTHQDVLAALNNKYKPADAAADTKILEEKSFDSIGPTVGQELRNKSIWAIIVVSFAIIAYIAFAFRKVSKPIASWKYGIIAVISLMHDIIIVVGAFALLGKFYGLEVNAPFIAALLTIFGYSNNDTIVVFDRIRENLKRRVGEDFDKVVDASINEVIVRSINTSFTVLLALFAIFVFGGKSIHDFTLALIIGVTIGTYSSIFLASPLLVVWEKLASKK